MLNFIWRWKVATTSILARVFYPHSSRNAAYQRLWKLERAGFMRARVDETGNHYLWVLDKRGFAVVSAWIAPLKDKGYLPNNWGHDLIVSAIHLGDGIFGNIPHLKTYTEQELRRIEPEHHPSWLPGFLEDHRSDGYWRVRSDNGDKTVGLEVELTQKRDREYRSIGSWADDVRLDAILWVVPRVSIGKTIQNHIRSAREKSVAIHNYALLDHVYEKGWQAPIFMGSHAGKMVSDILETKPRSPEEPSFAQFSLDTRKKAVISRPPVLYRIPQFS